MSDADVGRTRQLAFATALILSAVHVGVIAASVILGYWPVLPDGRFENVDLIPPFAAGRLALAGAAASAYDWSVLRQAMLELGGPGVGGWLYPPSYLFVMAPLAALPLLPALVAWLLATGAFFASALRAVVPIPQALLWAFAFPAAYICTMYVQSGFLFAGLIGWGLALLDRRPVVAGVMIGLVSMKPHLGLVFPLILAAGGRWQAFRAAAATVVALIVASGVAFGWEAWVAFWHSVSGTSSWYLDRAIAQDGLVPRSVHGLVTDLSGSSRIGAAVHVAVAGVVAVLLFRLWRDDATEPEVRSAAAVAGALLVTPYLFAYDVVVLAVGGAFLVRLGLRRGFRPGELTLLFVAMMLPAMSLPFLRSPAPLAEVLLLLLALSRGPTWRGVVSR